jgi:hypothetical protein
VDGRRKNGSGKERVMAGRRTDVGAGSKQQRDASDRKAGGEKDEEGGIGSSGVDGDESDGDGVGARHHRTYRSNS